MRIEIDFEQKTIILKDDCPTGELVNRLKELKLDDWEKWIIKAQDRTYEFYPTLPRIYPITYPTYPTTPTNPYNPPYIITYSTYPKTTYIRPTVGDGMVLTN